MNSEILFTPDIAATLSDSMPALGADKAFMLVDSGLLKCQPKLVDEIVSAADCTIFVVESGEQSKSIAGAAKIWEWLSASGATRRSLLINLGGGVVSDLGGFCAATFKRGIRHLNLPTTVLGAADAAVGGKTGIDFAGLKNEIGVFAPAVRVIVSPQPFESLPPAIVAQGMAEVLKMAMLCDGKWLSDISARESFDDMEFVARAAARAAREKEAIVKVDPREKGLRRVLNFGHTFAHAFESVTMQRGLYLSHGDAVAHGLLYALKLSEIYADLPSSMSERYRRRFLMNRYPQLPFDLVKTAADIERFLLHDKKNTDEGRVNFVLLDAFGKPIVKSLGPEQWRYAF